MMCIRSNFGHNSKFNSILLVSLIAFLLPVTTLCIDKISGRMNELIQALNETDSIKVWIYFGDKDTSPESFGKAAVNFTSRALQRRSQIPLDWYDLPIKGEYISRIMEIGGNPAVVSRWLNAVSVWLTKAEIAEISTQEYVRKINPVARAVRREQTAVLNPEMKPTIDSATYGFSYRQNHMLGIDSLHNLGLTGGGVLLAFFDTGYLTGHAVFDSAMILNTWDFINGDISVDDEISIGQTEHGTATLSACAGYDDGQLIGPAYRAGYILAKTEILNVEIQVEEDHWVAAAEWADSLGADIISASLGYSDWYTYSMMDGNTALTTVAADLAASRGILVVVSAGNEGNTNWHYIHAPADADSIISVGAVNLYEMITEFSSFGPSYDGRIKPELAAMGYGVQCANDNGGYTFKSGTSMSAPLIAGGAAMVLEAIPSLRGNPLELRRRLLASADRYTNPDNRYGYGIPDLVLAAGFGLKIIPLPMITIGVGTDTLIAFNSIAPPDETVRFYPIDIPDGSDFYDNSDGTASLRYRADITHAGLRNCAIEAQAGDYGDTLRFTINTTVSSRLVTVGPNPCTDSLRIFVNEYFPKGYKIEIFSLSGELVYRIFGQGGVMTWPVTNEWGEKVASGVYIIRFSADGIERKVKVYKI